jgi:hypothetical protein
MLLASASRDILSSEPSEAHDFLFIIILIPFRRIFSIWYDKERIENTESYSLPRERDYRAAG